MAENDPQQTFTNGLSTSVMKLYALGGIGFARFSRRKLGRGGRVRFKMDRNGGGTWMRFSSGSMATPTICGEPLIMKGKSLNPSLRRRETVRAAFRFLKKPMKRHGIPKIIVTDRLRSYRAAMRMINNEVRQETGRCLNNRAENSHQSFRQRERARTRFRCISSDLI